MIHEDWQVRVEPDVLGDGERLFIYRRDSHGTIVMEIDTGNILMHHVDLNERYSGPGISLPSGVAKAIADAVNPPDTAREDVVAELRTALAYERMRVDNLLERWVPGG